MSWVGNSDIAKVAQMAMDDRGDTGLVKSVSRNLVVPKHSSIAVNAIVHDDSSGGYPGITCPYYNQ